MLGGGGDWKRLNTLDDAHLTPCILLPLTVFCCVNVQPSLLSQWLRSLMPAVLQVTGVALCPPVVALEG